MPYQLVQISPRRFSVINKETGEVHAKSTTKAKAEAQLRLLRGVEGGVWRPSKNKWIVHVKKVAKEKGLTFKDALKVASQSYSKE